jgi:hypothetical protein
MEQVLGLPESVGRVLRCTIAAAYFTMASKPMLNRAGALYFRILTVSRNEGTRVPSLNTWTWRLLDEQNKR